MLGDESRSGVGGPEHANPPFPHMQEVIINMLLIQREGNGWEWRGNVFLTLAFSVQGQIPVKVCFIICVHLRVGLS